MKQRLIWILCSAFLLCCALGGCGEAALLDPKAPVTLTFWHVYGSQADSPMNELVDRFNATVGRERGVLVNVTSVSNSSAIHDALVAAAHGEPGAGELPDLFTCYPKTALAMGTELLLDWNDAVPAESREACVPAFLAEGQVNGAQLIYPIAKSSEVLFVNNTILSRFSAATGITLAELSTWEGVFMAARAYAEWTDALTPQTEGDAKAFLMLDDPFHFMQIAAAARGETLFDGEAIRFSSPAFEDAWAMLAQSATEGGLCLYGDYATTAMMTGDIVCGLESTASILYYKDAVTYPDNTHEPLELVALPFPAFAGKEKTVMQRGVGLGAVRTTQTAAAAAAVFLEWITETETNLEFVTAGGYLPVRREAFEALLNGAHGTLGRAGDRRPDGLPCRAGCARSKGRAGGERERGGGRRCLCAFCGKHHNAFRGGTGRVRPVSQGPYRARDRGNAVSFHQHHQNAQPPHLCQA